MTTNPEHLVGADRGLDRRRFLGGLGVAAAGGALGACLPKPFPWPPPDTDGGPGAVFPSGVVSGDPRPDGAVIWTAVAPPADLGAVPVDWQVASDDRFSKIVAWGSMTASAASAHTVKVAVTGLMPDRHYWYRFQARDRSSRIGRTRTAPAPGTMPSRLRIAFGSCQMWFHGWYNTWRDIARQDVDFVLFLGDYIYEISWIPLWGLVRSDPIGEAQTYEQYRDKYRLYRSDPDLQDAHAAHPMVVTWDDHEVMNDYYGGSAPARQSAAYRAWFEHMPVFPVDGQANRIHRSLPWGRLADLFVLDTRQHRDQQASSGDTSNPSHPANDPNHSILGPAQKAWLKSGMSGSSAVWRLFGNQTPVLPRRESDLDPGDGSVPTNAGKYDDMDAWDGYLAERREVLTHLESTGKMNNLFLTGDIHAFLAGRVRPDYDDPTSQVRAHEFVGGSMTSINYAAAGGLSSLFEWDKRTKWKEVDFLDLDQYGYGILDLTPEEANVEFRYVDIKQQGASPWTGARFRVRSGSGALEQLPV